MTGKTDNQEYAGTGCPTPDQLAAYLEGSLPAEAAPSLETHLAGCDLCRETTADFQAAVGGTAEISLVPDELLSRAKSLVEPVTAPPAAAPAPPVASPAPRPAAPRAWRPWLAAAAAAVVLLVAALIILLASQPSGPGSTGPGPVPEFSSSSEMVVETPAPARGKEEPPEEATPEPGPEKTPSEVETPAPAPEPDMPEPQEEPTPEEVEKPEAPRPPVPGKPAPAEVEKPRPKVPDKTEPMAPRKRTPLRVLSVSGKAWAKGQDRPVALAGQSLIAADSFLSTPAKDRARLVLEKGIHLFLNRSTETRIQAYADGMDLEVRNGEVLLEGIPDAFRLAVPGGWAEPALGASLLVIPARGAVRVSVVQGEVTVPGPSGPLSLAAGLSVVVDGSSPLKPTRFDANKALDWTWELRPDIEQVLLYDFESSLKGWKGKSETRDTFRHSRRSLRAIAVRDKDFSLAAFKSNRHLFVVRPGSFVRFACFVNRNLLLGMRLWNYTRKQGFILPLPGIAPNRWAYVQIDVNRAAGRLPMSVRPRLGDVISAVVVGARTNDRDALLIMDDFEVLLRKVPSRGHGRTGFRPLPPPPGAPDLDADCRCANRARSACCRFARIIRLMRRYQPAAGGAKGGRRGAGQGQGSTEPEPADGKDEEDDKPRDDGTEKAGNRPPGGSPPGGPGPGMPGPVPPGPAPVPPPGPPPGEPEAGQPKPSEEGKKDDDKKDEDDGKKPEPQPKKPKAEAKASDVVIHRWLKSQLPKCWPPFTDWKDDCGCGRRCKCRKAIARHLKRSPLPRPIWRRADRKVLGPFEAWLLGDK